MDCESAREAISARIDGEDSGVPDATCEEHLAGCADCRQWQQRAHTVTRRARLGGAFLDHDLAPRVLAAQPAGTARWRRRAVQRGALVLVALAQLAIAVPMLFLGHDHDAGLHAAHELGSFNLALAVAFAVGAARPRLSAGLAWPCAIAALGLVGTAVADLCSGQAIGADEAQHLVAVAGAALLGWQARTADDTAAAPAVLATGSGEGTHLSTAAFRADAGPEPPDGHAARLADPDVAARAAGQPGGAAPLVHRDGSRDESVA